VNGELVSTQDFAVSLPDDRPVVYVVGAHAHGMIDCDFNEKTIAVSQYGLAASVVLARITHAHEVKWGVL
jgi:rRNA small subunit pseudouridine methyltransferase Nep1